MNKQAGEAYADILFQYLQVFKNKDSWDWDDDTYPIVNTEYALGFYDAKAVPVYRIFDYNGDGSPELFVGIRQQKKLYSGSVADAIEYTGHKVLELAFLFFHR